MCIDVPNSLSGVDGLPVSADPPIQAPLVSQYLLRTRLQTATVYELFHGTAFYL